MTEKIYRLVKIVEIARSSNLTAAIAAVDFTEKMGFTSEEVHYGIEEMTETGEWVPMHIEEVEE